MNLILAHKSAKRFDSFVKDSSLFENMKILKRTDSKARESSQWNITTSGFGWKRSFVHMSKWCKSYLRMYSHKKKLLRQDLAAACMNIAGMTPAMFKL